MNQNLKYLIIDDVLSNPQELLEMAKEVTFYSSKQLNPVNMNGDRWKGYRSDFLDVDQKKKFMTEITQKILQKIDVTSFFVPETTLFNISAQTQVSFHYTTSEFVFERNDAWVHTDPHFLYSGVLYLTENPPKDSGTILFDGKKEIVIENKFNRLAFYRSDITHSSQSGFGETLRDSRLVLLFFVDKISLSLEKLLR